MTDRKEPKAVQKKTPKDSSEFEREQLRFLLSGDDIAATLVKLNPSLAWLPTLQEMNLIKRENQLLPWIELNFADWHAIPEVVANIHFFGPETARFLELRLNAQAESLPQLLVKSWRLIIRTMKVARQGLLQNEWFEITPQVKRGEYPPALLERIGEALRPKLKLGARHPHNNETDELPEHLTDLMSVGYEVADDLSADDILETWPKDTAANSDEKLLRQLSTALNATLDDAIDVGVESNAGYSTSDNDVPSVARHGQNSYRTGFQTIVRVIAELWLRLATKSPTLAMKLLRMWRDSGHRLVRRLALFAAADAIVPATFAADLLIKLPSGELFLTNSSVEVFRLIRGRWREFPSTKQHAILNRLCEGPPRDWFREGAEIDRAIDRTRYDVLSDMQRQGFDIGVEAKKVLNDITSRWPKWEPRPPQQAGFHIWFGSDKIEADVDGLLGIPDDTLVARAKTLEATADFLATDAWDALCLSDPDRALRGLAEAATRADWPVQLWQQLLWGRKEYVHADTEARIATLLLAWPLETFRGIAAPSSSWLNDHSKTLDDKLLWPLWDRVADASLSESVEVENE